MDRIIAHWANGPPNSVIRRSFFLDKIEKKGEKSYDLKVKTISHSAQETQKIANGISRRITQSKPTKRGQVVALEGELGAGKTTFVQGFARALGVKQKITSPTFVIMKRYKLKEKFLYHIDAYRLKNHRDLIPLGIKEIISDPANIIVIEWAERVKPILPKRVITIHLDHINEGKRKITTNF